MKIQGVILAGGIGSRLRPLTDRIPKPLLQIGSKTMIEYPLMKLVEADIKEITIVRQPQYANQFESILGNGSKWDISIQYVDHPKESYGMPYAISLAEPTINIGDAICVLCADVLFDDTIKEAINHFKNNPVQPVIIAAQVDDTAGFSHIKHVDGRVTEILSKDSNRHMDGIIDLGAIIYPFDVFTKAKSLYPSENEVPVTDLNNIYLKENRLQVVAIEGWWSDVGKNIEEYNKVNARYE